MKALFSKTTLAALALLAVASSTGCGIGGWSIDEQTSEIVGPGAARFTFCSSIAANLRKVEVNVYQIKDEWDLLVVQRGGQVVCLDYAESLKQAGVIPVPNTSDPPCSFCEGTPLPADLVLGKDDAE